MTHDFLRVLDSTLVRTWTDNLRLFRSECHLEWSRGFGIVSRGFYLCSFTLMQKNENINSVRRRLLRITHFRPCMLFFSAKNAIPVLHSLSLTNRRLVLDTPLARHSNWQKVFLFSLFFFMLAQKKNQKKGTFNEEFFRFHLKTSSQNFAALSCLDLEAFGAYSALKGFNFV